MSLVFDGTPWTQRLIVNLNRILIYDVHGCQFELRHALDRHATLVKYVLHITPRCSNHLPFVYIYCIVCVDLATINRNIRRHMHVLDGASGCLSVCLDMLRCVFVSSQSALNQYSLPQGLKSLTASVSSYYNKCYGLKEGEAKRALTPENILVGLDMTSA